MKGKEPGSFDDVVALFSSGFRFDFAPLLNEIKLSGST